MATTTVAPKSSPAKRISSGTLIIDPTTNASQNGGTAESRNRAFVDPAGPGFVQPPKSPPGPARSPRTERTKRDGHGQGEPVEFGQVTPPIDADHSRLRFSIGVGSLIQSW